MIPDSFSLRRIELAILFPGQPDLRREERIEFYNKVTAEEIDVPQFSQDKSSVSLARVESGSRGNTFQIEAGHYQNQFRFRVAEVWPRKRTLEVIGRDADTAWQCFRKVWSPERIGRKPSLVEVTIRTAASVKGGDATRFLQSHVFRMSGTALTTLRREPQGLGLRLMLPVEIGVQDGEMPPLNGAGGNIRVETLIEDRSRLYIEAQFRWPSVPVPREVRQRARGAPEEINPEVRNPSEYLKESDNYVKNELSDFLLESARE